MHVLNLFGRHSNKKQAIAINVSVFVCGAVLMVFELVGSRMFAPYLGTSTYVWTSLIGVILGFLSLGYWYGGKLADQKPNFETYAWVIFWAAISIVFTFCVQVPVLTLFQEQFSQIEISSVFSAIVLFAPASFLLGIVSPYAVRLKLVHLETSASTVGTLYAISTAGSIFGTFFAGFYLISHVGTAENILLLALVLLLIPPFFLRSKKFVTLIIGIVFLTIFLFIAHVGIQSFFLHRFHMVEMDSPYSRITLHRGLYPPSGKEVLSLTTDPYGIQCAMDLTDDDLVFDYTRFYRLDAYFTPNFKHVLMLGGCAYSYPKELLNRYADVSVDVAEIDPLMTKLAKTYFRLPDDPRLTTYQEDARTFLNTSKNTYDVIYGDAFNSFSSIPFQLTTKEAIQHEYDLLNDHGVVLANLISSVDGKKGKFLRAEYATYKAVFPQVYLFPVTDSTNSTLVQNILLVALKSQTTPDFTSANTELEGYLQNRVRDSIPHDLPILTDDFAPVDYYKRESL